MSAGPVRFRGKHRLKPLQNPYWPCFMRVFKRRVPLSETLMSCWSRGLSRVFVTGQIRQRRVCSVAGLLLFFTYVLDCPVDYLVQVPYQNPSSSLATAGNLTLADTDTCPTHPYYLPPKQLGLGGTSVLARAPVALTLAGAADPRSNLALFSCCSAS